MAYNGHKRPKLANGRAPLTWNKDLGVWTWNIPAWDTCPGRSSFCKAECYARKGNFTFPTVVDALQTRWDSTQDLSSFADLMVDAILWESRKGHTRFRIHSAGDFFSVDYLRTWIDIARRVKEIAPDVVLWTYTRTWRIPMFRAVLLGEAEGSPLVVWWSTDPTTGVHPDAPRSAFIHAGERYSENMPEPNCPKQAKQGDCSTCGLCPDAKRDAVTFLKH